LKYKKEQFFIALFCLFVFTKNTPDFISKLNLSTAFNAPKLIEISFATKRGFLFSIIFTSF